MEHIVFRQLTAYLHSQNLLPQMQSACRKGRSTETANLRVYSDPIDAIEKESSLCRRYSIYQPRLILLTATIYCNAYRLRSESETRCRVGSCRISEIELGLFIFSRRDQHRQPYIEKLLNVKLNL